MPTPGHRPFEDQHDDFRESFRRFVERELAPAYPGWEEAGVVPREAFQLMGRHGFLAMQAPERHGGAEVDDFKFNAVVGAELARAGLAGFGLSIAAHNDVCVPLLVEHGTDEQHDRWLPGLASGELIAAVAVTDEGAGPDARHSSMSAEPCDGGWSIDGSRSFVTNATNADLVITAIRTGPADGDVSLVVVERGTPGMHRGPNHLLVGLYAHDTADLAFEDVRVPAGNVVGEQGTGLDAIASCDLRQHVSTAVASLGGAQAALAWTLEYVRDRKAFGQPIAAFQNTRLSLAGLATEVEVTEAFVHECLRDMDAGVLTERRAAMAKLSCTELQGRAVDCGVQFHGGYGYMLEYPIARAYADARASRILGGSSELMKETIAAAIGL